MAIGDIKLGRGGSLRQATRVQADPDAFGAGLAKGLDALAGGFSDAAGARARMGDALRTRQDKQDRFGAEEQYQRWVGQENRLQAERLQNAEVDGRGITESSNTALEASREEFLKGLPASVQDEYRGRTANYTEGQITSAFNFEYQSGNEFFRSTTKQAIDQMAAGILTGDISPEEAKENVANLIDASDLPEAEQRELAITATSFLSKAEFQKEMEFARTLQGTVREPTGEDVVAAGLQGYERGMLNAISRPESGGQYNIRFGGADGPQTFDDFSQHPAVFVERKDGRVSSAAGRYQFTKTTWDQVSKELGLTDFSPESQDRAAIYLARQVYNKQVGAGELTFDQILQSGNHDQIKAMMSALTDENGGWEGFRHMNPDEFANIILGPQGTSGGGTGSQAIPNIYEDPRFASISFEDKNRLARDGVAQASAQLKAEVDARVKAETAAREAVLLGATQGEYTLDDEAALVEKGLLASSSDVNRFRTGVNAALKGQAEAIRVSGLLANNSLITSSDNAGLNTIIGDQGLAALREGNEEFAAQVFVPIVSRAGYLPSDSAKLLNDMILSNQPGAIASASDLLGQIHANDPHALGRSAGLSDDAKRMAVLSTTLRPYMTPAEIQKRLTDLRDPTIGSQIRQMRKDAREAFDENVTDSDLRSAYEARWLPGTRPDLPLDRGQAQVFRNDWKALYVEGMLVVGSHDGAMDYAQEQVAEQWSPSQIGGEERFMRNAPERYYESIADSHDWIDATVRQEAGLFAGEVFQLVADGQTLMEGDRYSAAADREGLNNASYQIMVRRPGEIEGTFVVEPLLRADGLPRRIAFEVSTEMRANVDRIAETTKLQARNTEILKQSAAGHITQESLDEFDQNRLAIEELNGQSPTEDPEQIVPDQPLGALEDEIAGARARLEVTEGATAEGSLAPGNFLVTQDRARLKALEDELARRKAAGGDN